MAAFDFRIGARVHCTDGPYGKLVKIVVDPKTQQVTDLVVEKGLLLKKDQVLPVSVVTSATENDIYLDVSSDDVSSFPEYREVTVTEPPIATDAQPGKSSSSAVPDALLDLTTPKVRKRLHEGVEADKAVLDRKSEVETLQKVIGRVDHVIVDSETDEITSLIMRRGLLTKHLVIPAEKVEEVDGGVFVPLTQDELAALPRYEPRSDDEILAKVRERLVNCTDLEEVEVLVESGIVHLQGSAHNRAARRRAQLLAASVAGVSEVDNKLVVTRDGDTTRPTDGLTG